MSDLSDTLRAYFETQTPAGVVSAYLFGSHARNAAHAESDVDVGVVADYRTLPERTERGRLALRLASDLIAVTHRNEVDVVVLNDASPELAADVLRRGLSLFCGDAAADQAFVRATLLRYADLRPFLTRTRRLKLRALLQ
ncbi:MAG: nucleotidyltransferase domain-containing protein [Acidobacteriota bacterium]